MTQNANYSINDAKLQEIARLVRQRNAELTVEQIGSYVLTDWPEGQEHQDWLDNASAEEIADWVPNEINAR